MCKISIIVPIYNVEEYLERCIDSILNQTFKDFEVILINDGSTDNSAIICDTYAKKDNRVKVIHKKNEGAAIARNVGLDACKGQYIGFVDSDDYISPIMYETLLNRIIKENAEIAICRYENFKSYDDIKFRNSKNFFKSFNNIEALENYFLDYGHKDRIMHTLIWDKLYKRELFDEIRFPNVSFAEDGYVVYKLLYKSKKTIFVNDTLYYYFERVGSLSRTTFSEKYLEIYKDRKEIFDFMYERNKSLAKMSVKSYIDKHILTYSQLNTYKNIKDVDIYIKFIKDDLKNDFKKFKELNIDKDSMVRVSLFIINYKLLAIYERTKNLIKSIKKKII